MEKEKENTFTGFENPYTVENPKRFFQGYEFREKYSVEKNKQHLIIPLKKLNNNDVLKLFNSLPKMYEILCEKMSQEHLNKWKKNGCLISFAFIDWYRLRKAWLYREIYFHYYLPQNKKIVISLDGDKFNSRIVLSPFDKPFIPNKNILKLFESYCSFIIPILEKAEDQTTNIELEELLFKDYF